MQSQLAALKVKHVALKKKFKAMQRCAGRWKKRSLMFHQQATILKNTSQQKYLVTNKKRRPTSKQYKVSIWGGYMLAVRRGIAHQGGTALCMTLDVNVTRGTITRWEKLLAANMIFRSTEWYENHYRYIAALAGRLSADTLTWEIHMLRGDATNSAVAGHGSKAHVVQLLTKFKPPA